MENYLIENTEIFLRIMSSLLAGGLIGFERERKGKAAGFVTNVLVCVGAASIAVIQCLIIKDMLIYDDLSVMRSDPSRLIAQIVSGVGFLGAGAILHEKGSVKGITTAATIWVVAAIGIAFGMGFYTLGCIVTATVYFSIMILKKIELYFLTNKIRVNFYLEYCNPDIYEKKIRLFLSEKTIGIRKFHHLDVFQVEENPVHRASIELIVPRYQNVDELIREICLQEEVIKFKKIKKRV